MQLYLNVWKKPYITFFPFSLHYSLNISSLQQLFYGCKQKLHWGEQYGLDSCSDRLGPAWKKIGFIMFSWVELDQKSWHCLFIAWRLKKAYTKLQPSPTSTFNLICFNIYFKYLFICFVTFLLKTCFSVFQTLIPCHFHNCKVFLKLLMQI